ncbi:PREDICTED: alpha-1,3-mannosyl-glycoprotein 4-beta-N-acetylglucosaminyltransferase-like protein [Galeopterus variegatus]|uniref:Alpha-1,3-mannosyl-glycoprotein 4-beta-N-acetylglucosaminyltransferase-like protein n=1 Tax=Galeopterus variegatus TaxID=482537 RepID=A0ABM0R5H1_GALVR|nr:PREDICTED: alpha-1,3-mannosyl-glycoprotein 4-beta-N-acetylglucosaminyltransferase-like protein [Galeopterus variegatus]
MSRVEERDPGAAEQPRPAPRPSRTRDRGSREDLSQGSEARWRRRPSSGTNHRQVQAAPRPSTMHCCRCRYVIVAVSLVVLGFFLPENKEEHVEYSTLLKEKEDIAWQIAVEQISSESKNHVETFKEMQKNSPLLQHTNYKFLAGAPPQKKKLLTVGISVWRPHGSYLLDTLRSLFQASSEPELQYIVVLLHLADPDPKWLGQTVANISGLFAPQIEAGNLLVALGLLSGSPLPGDLKNVSHASPCEGLYSRQKAAYALLMNLASTLSDYFLLMEDNVRCTPKFVTAIYSALSAWKELPWAMLEFSSLRFSGKVFHTSDLSRLASFLLLFHKDTPTDLLLSNFGLLLAQNVPIHFSPSVFYHMGTGSEFEDTCFPVEKDKVFSEPDNPTASVLTDMMSLWSVIPQYAYTLNEECFSTLDPVKGNHLTVVLDRPQKVIRIAVLTGSHEHGKYLLQQGQVELGYDLMEDPKDCARYTLLGPLVRGNLDQRVFYEEHSVEELSCIRLLVLASQESWLLIRQIRVWTDPAEEER